MNWQDEGFLLSKVKFRENANIINVFTNTRGKIGGIVYGSSSHGRVVVVGVVVVYIDVDKAKKIFYKFKRGLVCRKNTSFILFITYDHIKLQSISFSQEKQSLSTFRDHFI